MKIHLAWFCVSIAALLIGTQFAKKEVRIVEKPVEIVKAREVFIERPATHARELEKATPAIRTPASTPINKRDSVTEKAKLHRRYDPFLKKIGLTAEQMDRFVELKLATYDVQDDLQAAVEQNNVPGDAASVKAMRSQLTMPMWDEIRQLLGEDGFKAYRDYEGTSAVRPTVDAVFRSAGVSMSEQEADQVARLVMKNTESYREKPTDISSRMRINWNAVAHEAHSFLTPAQVDAIKRWAAEFATP